MLGNYKYITDPAERRAIGDDARERHLRRAPCRIAVEHREAKRSIDRAVHDVARYARGPIRFVVEEPPHEIAIDVSRIARNDVLFHARRV